MLNLRKLAKDRWLTQMDICKILGVAQSKVSMLMNRPERIRPDIINKLTEHFGEDVVKQYMTAEDVDNFNRSIADAVDPEIVEEIKEEVRQEIKEKIEDVESFLIVPEVVNAEPNANIEEVIEEDGTELEAISPNLLLSDMKVSVAEQIKGTSMLPTFQPNDWVFIRFLKDTMKIVSGKTYYLKCRNRPTMIRRVKFEGEDKLRLIAKNSEYDDIVICRSDIINIGNVVALFRMTFGDQYSELEELRREKEAEREKKDTQIDKMLDMMKTQSEQQDKLIDFITKTK